MLGEQTVAPRAVVRLLLRSWSAVLRTGNLPARARIDPVSRWLLATRASVFTMTLTSAAIGGLLAAARDDVAWLPFVLAAAGLVLSHAVNNMTNDLLDFESGVDTPDYARAQYAPHPLLSGLVSKRALIAAIFGANVIAAGIATYLTVLRGWAVLLFVGLGFAISFFYVAPPLRLKHHGLGELGVFVVWGPLMIGGTYYVAAGSVAPWVFLASLPYALLVTTVLLGKHLDKYAQDRAKRIGTLVVLLGERASLALTKALLAGFYVVTFALVLVGVFDIWVALVVLSLPRLRAVLRVYSQPKPEVKPANYPIWPLWYVAWAFVLNRPAGYLLVAGLVVSAVFPVHLPRLL